MKILFEGSQIVMAEVHSGMKSNLVILGNGFSIGDPFFSFPNRKRFSNMGTVMAMFFKKECTGLEAAQEELAEFIRREHNKYDRVVLYGQSKCGVMFYNTLSLLATPVTAICVSSPFGGTFWANKEAVKEKLWTNRNFFEKLFKGWQYFLYKKIFSDHPVDRDLIEGSEYLSKERVIPECHTVVCVTALCYDFLEEISKCKFKSAVCSTLNKYIGQGVSEAVDGDGIVRINSQIPPKMPTSIRNLIRSSHITSFDDAVFVLREHI